MIQVGGYPLPSGHNPSGLLCLAGRTQTLVEWGCGLGVHQATVVACLLTVGEDGRVQKQMPTFGTTTRELLCLREWLLSQGCTHLATESTGFVRSFSP